MKSIKFSAIVANLSLLTDDASIVICRLVKICALSFAAMFAFLGCCPVAMFGEALHKLVPV